MFTIKKKSGKLPPIIFSGMRRNQTIGNYCAQKYAANIQYTTITKTSSVDSQLSRRMKYAGIVRRFRK